MFVIVALVVLALAPDKPITLIAQTRFATEQQCEKAIEHLSENLTGAYGALGLQADVEVRCVPTGKYDI